MNPAAGGGNALDSLLSLQAYAQRTGWAVDFRITNSAQDLSNQAHTSAAEGQERIFVLGGDGSFQDLVNALAKFPQVILGILPAGCGNDLASSLGLPNEPLRAAELLRKGEVHCMDVVRAQTSDGRERLFTGGGGVGLDAEACHIAATRFRNLPGRLRYLLSAARAYADYHPIQVRLTMESPGGNQEKIERNVLLAGVLNTPSYGAGLKFAPQAKTNDGVLNLVLVEDLPLIEILQALPRLILQGEVRSRRVQCFPIHRITIETGSPCRFHGDGEILGYTPVELGILSRAIRVLCPPDSPLNS